MSLVNLHTRDLAALGAEWRQARPFGHVVVDGLLAPDDLAALSRAVSEEPHWPNRGEIYDQMASALEPLHPRLQAFGAAMGAAETRDALRAITGVATERVEVRSYGFIPGSYLLPHSDCRAELGRRLAYAFYVWCDGCVGGELELFECDVTDQRIVATRGTVQIPPRANRLVVFDVSPLSLHQVREVTAGARLSLSGWYY